MPRCGIVILAAGASTRMGTPKQLLFFDGSTLLNRAVQTAIASRCRPIVVVLGSGAEGLKSSLQNLPVTVVINDQWQGGMGTSIRTGIAALKSTVVDAAMIFLCDQPLVTAAALDQLVEAHFTTGKPITAAFYDGSHGTPAIFSTSLFDELISLEDSQGGKAVINRHASQLQSIELHEAAIDIDTKSDFDNLCLRR